MPLRAWAGLPGTGGSRRSAAVQAARSALASAGLPARGLDGKTGVIRSGAGKHVPIPPPLRAHDTMGRTAKETSPSLTGNFRLRGSAAAGVSGCASPRRPDQHGLPLQGLSAHELERLLAECRGAEVEARIAGFSDLAPDGHVDMLYVDPDFQRRGVARALLEHIEQALAR
jgi:hypothetical protein